MDDSSFEPASLKRPHESLLTYYMIISLGGLIFAPIVFIPHYIKYKTMRYSLDDEGISMRWGFFFRKEVYLTYRRLQDIHVTRNIIERWLGLAKVPIQTASGTSGATMTIEGVRDPEPLRDFLYERMRGAREQHDTTTSSDDVLGLLTEIRDELKRASERQP